MKYLFVLFFQYIVSCFQSDAAADADAAENGSDAGEVSVIKPAKKGMSPWG